jgi:hypothetical protein
VIVIGLFAETCDHNNITTYSLNPPVECNDPIVIVDMEDVDFLATQGGRDAAAAARSGPV